MGQDIPDSCSQGEEGSPSEILSAWLGYHSIPSKDPWEEGKWQDHTPVSQDRVCCDPTHGREEEEGCQVHGRRDEEGRLDGSVSLLWDNGDSFKGTYVQGVRSGWGIVNSPEREIQSITGKWEEGELVGKGRMVTNDTAVYESWFLGSSFHGPARKIVMKKFKTFRQQVSWLGCYRSGVAHGQCWEWLEGGGYLTGVVDHEGQFTGDNIAFVYPDLQTALLGTFRSGVMISARPATLDRVEMVGGMAHPIFSWITGDQVPVRFCLSTETSVGEGPTVRDPYEDRTCQVLQSHVAGGGEGLYAARDLEKEEIVAFYNGVRLPYKPGEKENWETSGYKIFVNADHTTGERIDLPGDLIYTHNYCATLGHKMNHNFNYNCKEWFVQHPRHGIIPCAKADRKILAGEELFLHYGYDPLNCPAWYKEALDTFLEDNPGTELWDAANPNRLDEMKLRWSEDETYLK